LVDVTVEVPVRVAAYTHELVLRAGNGEGGSSEYGLVGYFFSVRNVDFADTGDEEIHLHLTLEGYVLNFDVTCV